MMPVSLHATTATLPWTARAAVRAFTADLRAGVTYCRHFERTAGPVFWAMWARGSVVCQGCLPMLKLTGEEDDRCDHCRGLSPRIHLGQTGIGKVVLMHGACPPCEKSQKKRTA